MKKTALITGACINTGVAIVEKFASEGRNVVFTGRNAERVAAAQAAYRAKFPEVDIIGYVIDAGFADTGIELTSSGTCDDEETNWRVIENILPQVTQNGWNEIRLPFSTGGKNGETDWSRLNFFRLFFTESISARVFFLGFRLLCFIMIKKMSLHAKVKTHLLCYGLSL